MPVGVIARPEPAGRPPVTVNTNGRALLLLAENGSEKLAPTAAGGTLTSVVVAVVGHGAAWAFRPAAASSRNVALRRKRWLTSLSPYSTSKRSRLTGVVLLSTSTKRSRLIG